MKDDWDFLVPGEIQIFSKGEKDVLYTATANAPSPVIVVLSNLLEDMGMHIYKKTLGPKRFERKMEKILAKMLGSVMIQSRSLKIYNYYYYFEDLVGNSYKVTFDYTKLLKKGNTLTRDFVIAKFN